MLELNVMFQQGSFIIRINYLDKIIFLNFLGFKKADA